MKKVSAGIIIINEFNEILMGRATGSNPVMWDLPKGAIEKNETPIHAAIRECKEEFGISFNDGDLTEIGKYTYNKEKNIHLFYINVFKHDIDMTKLQCVSEFVNFRGIVTKEIDDYQWVKYSEIPTHCGKSMTKVLTTIGQDTDIFNVEA